MKVSEWITTHTQAPVTVAAGASFGEITDTFLSHPGLRDLYVLDPEGVIVGSLHHRRLAQILLAEHLPVHDRHQLIERVSGGVASEIMEREFVSAHPDEELDNVLHRMLEYEVEDMPVLDDSNSAVGSIRLTEVLRAAQNNKL